MPPKFQACQLMSETAKAKGLETSPEKAALAVNYLMLFGYLAKEVIEHVSADDIARAVKAFQRLFGIKPDGLVGPRTLRAMAYPRCGCPDVVIPNTPYAKLLKAAQTNLPAWRKRDVTYYIDSYVAGLGKSDQQAIIAQAWQAWTNVCGIRVLGTGSAQSADIIITTGSGPQDNFDGPGGTLAWAYIPDGNDRQLLMKFDMSESWSGSMSQRGILMLNVATHEFGHLLGLDHSRVPAALMAAFYNPGVGTPQWNDDIPRVRARYGNPAAAVAPPAGGKTRRLVLEVGEIVSATLDDMPVALGT